MFLYCTISFMQADISEDSKRSHQEDLAVDTNKEDDEEQHPENISGNSQ